MRTNIDIDSGLVDEAKKLGGTTTIKETVHAALQEYVNRRKQKDILKLFGKIDMQYDIDDLRSGYRDVWS